MYGGESGQYVEEDTVKVSPLTPIEKAAADHTDGNLTADGPIPMLYDPGRHDVQLVNPTALVYVPALHK
jgi:hypothetical protein